MTIEEQHNGDFWGDRRLFCILLVVVTQSYTHDTSHRTVLQKGVSNNAIFNKDDAGPRVLGRLLSAAYIGHSSPLSLL